MSEHFSQSVYYLARGRSLEVVLAYEGRLRAYFEDYATSIVKDRPWIGAQKCLVLDHNHIVGWSGPQENGLRVSRLGFLVPNGRTELGKALLRDLRELNAKHDRLSGESFTAELTGEPLVLSRGLTGLQSVTYGYGKIGNEFVICAPEGCPVPLDAERIERSDYWSRKEVAEKKALSQDN